MSSEFYMNKQEYAYRAKYQYLYLPLLNTNNTRTYTHIIYTNHVSTLYNLQFVFNKKWIKWGCGRELVFRKGNTVPCQIRYLHIVKQVKFQCIYYIKYVLCCIYSICIFAKYIYFRASTQLGKYFGLAQISYAFYEWKIIINTYSLFYKSVT